MFNQKKMPQKEKKMSILSSISIAEFSNLKISPPLTSGKRQEEMGWGWVGGGVLAGVGRRWKRFYKC